MEFSAKSGQFLLRGLLSTGQIGPVADCFEVFGK